MRTFCSSEDLQEWLDALRAEPDRREREQHNGFCGREWSDDAWEMIRQILATAPLASSSNRKLFSISVKAESSEPNSAAWRTICFHLDLNSCGVKAALLSNQSREFPVSLLPLIMERLQHIGFFAGYYGGRPTDEQQASRLLSLLSSVVIIS